MPVFERGIRALGAVAGSRSRRASRGLRDRARRCPVTGVGGGTSGAPCRLPRPARAVVAGPGFAEVGVPQLPSLAGGDVVEARRRRAPAGRAPERRRRTSCRGRERHRGGHDRRRDARAAEQQPVRRRFDSCRRRRRRVRVGDRRDVVASSCRAQPLSVCQAGFGSWLQPLPVPSPTPGPTRVSVQSAASAGRHAATCLPRRSRRDTTAGDSTPKPLSPPAAAIGIPGWS